MRSRKLLSRVELSLFLVTLLLILADGWFCLNSFDRADSTREQAKRSHQLIDKMHDVLSALTDAETSVRGFRLTLDKTFLDPYESALIFLRTALPDLLDAATEVPASPRFQSFGRLVQEELDWLQPAKAQAASLLPMDQQEAREREGKLRMDRCRATAHGLELTQQGILDGRRAIYQRDAAHVRSTIAASILCNVLLLGALFYVVRRQAAHRVAADEKLRSSAQKLRAIVDHSDALIFMKDLQGRYLLTNAGFEGCFLRSRSELEGRTDYEIFDEATAQEMTAHDWHVLAAREKLQLEEVFPPPSGRAVNNPRTYLSFRFPLLDDRSEVYALCCIAADITDRKKAERDRQVLLDELEERIKQRTAQLAETNIQLEAFSYTVAHDLRAPLRAIRGFSELALGRANGTHDGETNQFLGKIAAGARRMQTLIDDLLAYSGLTQTAFTLTPIDLETVVREVLELFAEDLERNQVVVEVGRPLEPVLGERSALGQVLQNLVSNAAKFRSENPKIEIFTTRSGNKVRLWVKDNGIGIEKAYLERVYRVFERLHPLETYPGTGMGLAIVKKAAERMGGMSGVDSEIGLGSNFWIELDAAQPA